MDVLLSLPHITGNCVQKHIENVQLVSANCQDPQTSTTEKSVSLQDQNVHTCLMQVTDTQNKLTESASAKLNLEPNFDSTNHSYCSAKNKNVPEAETLVVQTLYDDDNAPYITNTASNVQIHELNNLGIQIDMTTHELMLNPITMILPEPAVLGLNGYTDQTQESIITEGGKGFTSPDNSSDKEDGDTLNDGIGINNPVVSEDNLDLQTAQNGDTDNPYHTTTSLNIEEIKNINADHKLDVHDKNGSSLGQELHSSSSEFDGFNSDDLVPNSIRIHSDSNSSSDDNTNSEFEYEDVIDDSSDTIPAIDNHLSADNMNDSNNDLQDLFLVRNQTVDVNVLKLWEDDAKTKKWDIPLCKPTAREVYDISYPPPKWDEIDPYLGLEEENAETNENPPNAGANDAPKSDSKYEMRKRSNSGKATRKSNCISGK